MGTSREARSLSICSLSLSSSCAVAPVEEEFSFAKNRSGEILSTRRDSEVFESLLRLAVLLPCPSFTSAFRGAESEAPAVGKYRT